jgi:hypothetical protein
MQNTEFNNDGYEPVVRPLAYRERTAWMATYIAGTLKVSNII